MNRKVESTWIILCICMVPLLASAGEDFQWEPITDSDWSVSEDPLRGIHDAVMIFERIVADDQEWLSDKCYYRIYRRIRILSSEGRRLGDVVVPYTRKEAKLEDIRGRTVHRDGREFALTESQVYEKEVLKAEGMKIKQKSFSLPAISDDCIIEYYIKYRLHDSPHLWLIQKDMFMIEGEYVWRFYRGEGLSSEQYQVVADKLAPNYLAMAPDTLMEIEQRPSIKAPEEVVFTVSETPAFESEPYSPPDRALRWQLRHYYGESRAPAAYWGNLSGSISDDLREFAKKNKRVREVTKSFGQLTSSEEKVHAAYTWLQENIRNTDYDDSNDEFKDNECADDVIKRGYGTARDINMTLCDMLREMNIDAKMAFGTDRDENLLVYDAKYWQFDRSLVAVFGEDKRYRFYDPGGKCLPVGGVAWFNEGTSVLVVGDMNRQFLKIPFSDAMSNQTTRHELLTMNEESEVRGRMIENHKGHSARPYRLRLSASAEKEITDHLQEEFLEHFPNGEADSFSIAGLGDIDEPITIECNMTIPSVGQKMGNRVLLKPSELFSGLENPFKSDTREHPIMFDYASEIIETLTVNFPGTWAVEALPSDSVFSNQIGQCQIAFTTFGNTLSVQRMFTLNRPSWPAARYEDVKKLFQTRQALAEMIVVLTTSSLPPKGSP